MRTTAYRYPGERLILGVTILLVLGVIALTATATVCTSAVFILAFVGLAYQMGLSHHRQLVQAARRVEPQGMPVLTELVRSSLKWLRPGEVEVYVLPSREMNAYTFGLGTPKVVVLYSALLKIMDADEMQFILGHELGHVALGHTWLNSLVGGLAGVPSPFSAAALLALAFLWWNRACEYSADRAGLLTCGKPEKAVSALVKLAAGPKAFEQGALEAAYRKIDAEDDTLLGGLNEALGTHPMLIRRIDQLRAYAASPQYRRLRAQIEGAD